MERDETESGGGGVCVVTFDSSSVVDCGRPEPWSAVCKMGVMSAEGERFHEGDVCRMPEE